jgi:hypothetical protein
LRVDDPLPRLTVLVRRKVSDGFVIGAGALISPGLVLTALHVVCDTGPDAIVPASANLDKIDAKLGVKLGASGDRPFFDARLIWPEAGAPARSGGWDVALLALHDRLVPAGTDKPRPRSVAVFTETLERFQLREDFGRVTLGWERDHWLLKEAEWRFGGFPAIAKAVNEKGLLALGERPDLDVPSPRLAKVPTLTPDAARGDFVGYSPSLADWLGEELPPHPRHAIAPDAAYAATRLEVEAGNMLGGTSGAVLYGFHLRGNVGRAYIAGVVSRARLGPRGGQDLLRFAPIPERGGRADAGPDAGAREKFWELVDGDRFVRREPVRVALDALHLLDRKREAEAFHQSCAKEKRVQVFGFACAPVDLQEFLFLRFETESVAPSSANFAPLFDLQKLSRFSETFRLNPDYGDEAWLHARAKIAQKISADPVAGDEVLGSFTQRFANSLVSRVLRFVVDPQDVFDPALVPTPWAVSTLSQMLQDVSQWAKAKPTPPLGSPNFTRANPIVVLLALLDANDGAAFTREDFARIRRFAASTRELFAHVLEIPQNVHCDFLEQPLGPIDYEDYIDWYRERVDANDAEGNARSIAGRIGPTFNAYGNKCRKQAILTAITAIQDLI